MAGGGAGNYYKMLGRDIYSNPTQYRTWISQDTPDFEQRFIYPYVSGPFEGIGKVFPPPSLVDVSAYPFTQPGTYPPPVFPQFSFPIADEWRPIVSELYSDFSIRKVMPPNSEGGAFCTMFYPEYSPSPPNIPPWWQVGMSQGFGYIFGGKVTNKIFICNLANPAEWYDSGATLPTPLYNSHLIIDGFAQYIWLFGGNDGNGTVSTIFKANISDPLTWIDTGDTLSQPVESGRIGYYEERTSPYTYYWFIAGGQVNGEPSKDVLNCYPENFPNNNTNLIGWGAFYNALPVALYDSTLAYIQGYFYLFGGLLGPNKPTNTIYKSVDAHTWSLAGHLPYNVSNANFFNTGYDGYLIGQMSQVLPSGPIPEEGFTPILHCSLFNPIIWNDTNKTVPGNISGSIFASIADKLWLFGGNSNTEIFACNQIYKYSLTDPKVVDYWNINYNVLDTEYGNSIYYGNTYFRWNSDLWITFSF